MGIHPASRMIGPTMGAEQISWSATNRTALPREAAHKAALAALARSLAVEYGPKGVRVNVVAPGMTQTDMLAHIPEKTKVLARMNTPLRRLGEPSDVADVVAFLVGPGSRHVSGETIRVCGGLVM